MSKHQTAKLKVDKSGKKEKKKPLTSKVRKKADLKRRIKELDRDYRTRIRGLN